MNLHLIRSATMRITYGGLTFLTDPYLSPKNGMPSYTGASLNPLVDLPCPPEDVVAGVDVAVISHLHSDHFDPTARRLLPRDLMIFCQPEDVAALEADGFRHVVPVANTRSHAGIILTRIPGQHGSGDVLDEMGPASGFILRAAGEPTVYWIGDTVWCPVVAETLNAVRPDVIITHSGGAVWGDHVPIIMDVAQTVAVCRAAPQATVVAVHMEALDHQTVTRAALRAHADACGISRDHLRIPADGERLIV